MSRFSAGFIFPLAAVPAAIAGIAFQGNSQQTTASATVSYVAVSIGTASADRYVLCCHRVDGGTASFSSATIGGIAATILSDPNSGPHDPVWFGANVPTGATANIDITMSGGQTEAFALDTWTFTGSPNPTLKDSTDFVGTATTFTNPSISTDTGGAVFSNLKSALSGGTPATWSSGSPAETVDQTNVTFNTNKRLTARHVAVAAASTATIGATSTGSNAAIRISGISLSPG